MAIQNANLGTAPSGAGGDTFRSAATKFNENFTNYAHAASRLVGGGAGNVMEVGAFGLGESVAPSYSKAIDEIPAGFFKYSDGAPHLPSLMGPYDNYGINFTRHAPGFGAAFFFPYYAYSAKQICLRTFGGTSYSDYYLRHSQNTTVDSNGFLKNASPIVQLYSDKIELNDEAAQQNITFEKLGVGDYLIKGSTGFAQDGWYIETPKDANGNVLFSVIYETLEDGDISVKTYKKKFDFETVSIIADLDNPVDITENRWIDLRLQELPQPEIEVTDDPEQ